VQLHPRPPAAAAGGFKQTYTPGGAAEGPVKVSLNDCLACSGCVTSAETVLLENQSVGELSARLTEPGAVVVVSVSPQSRASLAGACCAGVGWAEVCLGPSVGASERLVCNELGG